MSPSSKVQTRLKPSLFSRQKQLLSLQVLKGISLVRTYAHLRVIYGIKIGIYLGISQVYVVDIPVPPGQQQPTATSAMSTPTCSSSDLS